MLFGRKKNKDTASTATPSAKPLIETQHFAASIANGIVLGEVRCEQITERESKVILAEIAQATDEAGSARLVIDMKHVGVLASAGIGSLVQVHKRLKASGGGLAIYGLSEDIEQLMKLTRMDKLFNVVSTRDDAIASVS